LKKSLVIDKSFSGPGADTESGVVYREHVEAYLGYRYPLLSVNSGFRSFLVARKTFE
jgi:hypothetical protein